jgi:methylase of polypeptide subunit release factors
MEKEFVPDSVVQAITERFLNRAKFGFQKYGTDLDRVDLSPRAWGQHILEETHDQMLYIQKWLIEQEKQDRLVELLMKGTTEGTILHLDYNETKELKALRLWWHEHQHKPVSPR